MNIAKNPCGSFAGVSCALGCQTVLFAAESVALLRLYEVD